VYYKTYDSPARAQDLPAFYRASSAVSWNGNPTQGVDGVRDLLGRIPRTRHEVQSYDCHPIPSASCPPAPSTACVENVCTASQPPALLVTVSGSVQHGPPPTSNPRQKVQDGQPRVFSQAFMLVPDMTAAPAKAGEVGKYYIASDSMRFVG
jgi:NTF2-related export protein 1/2